MPPQTFASGPHSYFPELGEIRIGELVMAGRSHQIEPFSRLQNMRGALKPCLPKGVEQDTIPHCRSLGKHQTEQKALPAATWSTAAPAYYKGRIYYNTLDVHTVAVDANTGKEAWKARLGDINLGESFTMAPLVVKGKVLVGNSGGEFGVRGWLAALDADTGKLLWRAYATGPDRDVLIGPNFKPYYEQDRGTDLGMKTWQGQQWKIGGGAGWSWISYDPGLDLIYYGTANPGPWNGEQRPGDNEWTCTLFARKRDSAEAIWAYQINPHDDHDYDGVNENILLDLTIQGRPRKVLAHPDRNARMYIIDRVTGEVLSAEPFTYQNTSESVNLKTGKIKYAASKPQASKPSATSAPGRRAEKTGSPPHTRPAPA